MATLAQALQEQPKPGPEPWIVTVVSSTPDTIQTAAGPVANGLWGNAPAGSRVVVQRVQGIDVAIALLGN